MYKQELQRLLTARRLMMLYISMKFHKNILNGFRVIERTRITLVEFQRGKPPKLYQQELRFLLFFFCSARCLMMLYISIKVLETILNGFQVMERTRLYHCQSYMDKSNGSVLAFCTSQDDALYLY